MQPVSDSEHQNDAAYAFDARREPQFLPGAELDQTAQKEGVSDDISKGMRDPGWQHGDRDDHREDENAGKPPEAIVPEIGLQAKIIPAVAAKDSQHQHSTQRRKYPQRSTRARSAGFGAGRYSERLDDTCKGS
jgi:hypothetical protein